MNANLLANGLLVAVLVASSGIAMAQSTDQPTAKTPESASTEMQPMPGMRGPTGEHPGRGMMGGGMMGGGMMGGGMMGGCPMMGHLTRGNEKLSMRIHGEMMVAIGNILIKHADSIQSRASN